LPKRSKQVTVAATVRQLLQYDPKRTAYRIYNSGAATIFIGPDQSLTILTGHGIKTLDKELFSKLQGDDVDSPVYVISAAGGEVVTVLEEFGEES